MFCFAGFIVDFPRLHLCKCQPVAFIMISLQPVMHHDLTSNSCVKYVHKQTVRGICMKWKVEVDWLLTLLFSVQDDFLLDTIQRGNLFINSNSALLFDT